MAIKNHDQHTEQIRFFRGLTFAILGIAAVVGLVFAALYLVVPINPSATWSSFVARMGF